MTFVFLAGTNNLLLDAVLGIESKNAEGETEQRLYAVMVWEETAFLTERERPILAWTEAVTLVGQGHLPDDIHQLARGRFSDNELVNLTLAITRHQRMEPMGDQFSRPTWVLPTCQAE